MTNRETKEVAEMIEAAKELARADEREKLSNATEQPQGVEVWVSWDSGVECNPVIANKEPIISEQIGVYYHSGNGLVATEIFEGFARLLNISPGDCKKFRIVEVEG